MYKRFFAVLFFVGLVVLSTEAQSTSADAWEWVIKPQYGDAGCFSEGYAAVEVGEKYGFIDMNGKWIVKPKFEYAMDFENGYAIVQVDGRAGIIDKKGKWVVKPKLLNAWSRPDGKFEGYDKDYRWAFMDEKGKYIVKPGNIAINADEGVYFSEGLAAVYCTDEKYSCRGYIDEKGKWVIAPQFSRATDFHEGLAWVLVNDSVWGVIDTTGKWVVKPQYGFDHYHVLGFSEGLSPVAIDGKEGYMDRDGNIVIKPQFDFAGPFENGKAWFLNKEDWGFVDKDGNIIFSLKHDNANAESEDDLIVCVEPMNGEPSLNISFCEGLAVYRQEGKKGYINERGEWAIAPRFDGASDFKDGLALASVGGKWGIIDLNGNWVVEPKFEDLFRVDGRWLVLAGDKWGFIDIKGNWVVEPMYDDVEPLKEGILAVEVGGKWGLVDRNFKYLAEPQFDGVFCYKDGVVAVRLNGKWGYIRLK